MIPSQKFAVIVFLNLLVGNFVLLGILDWSYSSGFHSASVFSTLLIAIASLFACFILYHLKRRFEKTKNGYARFGFSFLYTAGIPYGINLMLVTRSFLNNPSRHDLAEVFFIGLGKLGFLALLIASTYWVPCGVLNFLLMNRSLKSGTLKN